VVIAIIGLLASIVLVSYEGSTDKARLAKTLSWAGSISHLLGANAVGVWTFDNISGATVIDDSGLGNNGIIYGATLDDGVVGKALSFDGNDYIEVASSDSLNPGTSNFTIAVWFKTSSAGSLNGAILYNKENLYEASAGGGYFTYAWQPYWAWTGGTSFPINVGQWYFAVVVFDHSKQYIYKDSQLVFSRNQTGDIGSNANALRIGARGAPSGAGSFFRGTIDDVRIYSEALPQVRIEQLYADGFATHQNLAIR